MFSSNHLGELASCSSNYVDETVHNHFLFFGIPLSSLAMYVDPDTKPFLVCKGFRSEMDIRFIDLAGGLLKNKPPDEREVLEQGYF